MYSPHFIPFRHSSMLTIPPPHFIKTHYYDNALHCLAESASLLLNMPSLTHSCTCSIFSCLTTSSVTAGASNAEKKHKCCSTYLRNILLHTEMRPIKNWQYSVCFSILLKHSNTQPLKHKDGCGSINDFVGNVAKHLT